MGMVLIILTINIVYVSFFTVRMILTLKGQKYLASFLSSIEVVVYVIGLGLVLDNLDQIQNLIAYALGFGLGVLAGSYIEQWLALGYITVRVITKRTNDFFPDRLRDAGFGVTAWSGEGRDGERLMMEILTPRRDQKTLYNYIMSYDEKAFIVSHEPQHFHGGFWVRGLKKHPRYEETTFSVVHEENLPGVTEDTIEAVKASDEWEELPPHGETENGSENK